MAIVSEHAPGSPCWFELGTTNQSGAKQFYTELLGWTAVDMPMGPDEFYTMFQLEGHDVGAGYTLPKKLLDAGVPPHWGVYFATPNVDEYAAKVTALGGSLVQPPFDVMDVGRMSICKDPGGAVFSLWQPKKHRGALIIGQNNAVCWSELATPDSAQARKFYSELFGWQTKSSANMETYIEFSVAGEPRGGLLQMDAQWAGIPSHWGIYFMAADCDALTAKAKSLGATVRHGPFTAPGVGRIAMMADPQGAGFSLITLTPPGKG